MSRQRWIALPLLLATLALPMSASAGESAESTESAIRNRLHALETAWAKGDAKFIATQVYGRDAVIHGEGQPALVNTPQAVLDTINHLVADSRSVKLDLHSVRQLSPTAAHSWVTWQVTPKAEGEKPFAVRALFVWTKGQEGWRIRADMYSMGSM